MENKEQQFVPGKTYGVRSIGDHECVFSFEIIRRTAKTVWIKGPMVNGEARRIDVQDGVETIMPLGRYSMAPCLKAA